MEESSLKRRPKQKQYTLSSNPFENSTELQKRYFDDDNNFIDYFIEVGVNPIIFKQEILYQSNKLEELEKLLKPQILSKFPSFDKRTVVVEDNMKNQIFPHGFHLIESIVKKEPYFYCLILDNQLYSAIYPRKYLACLIIYESIEQYKMLYDKYKSEGNNDANKKDIKKKKQYLKYKNYYIPKCLCLVSVHPYIDKYEEILKTIYNLFSSGNYPSLFLDQIIEKMIIETPKIPRGLKKIVLQFPDNQIELTETKMNEFPSVNVNLSYTFELLSYNNIIEIYKYLLYETKLIFFSENLYNLTNTILSFIFLLTPFNYQFQIVSILSQELYSFIETISPFIFGINEKYSKNFFANNKIIIGDTLCIIDIDSNAYYMVAPGGVLNSKDYPEIPKKLRKKLEDKLKAYLINKKKKKFLDTSLGFHSFITIRDDSILPSTTSKSVGIDKLIGNFNDEEIHRNTISNNLFNKSKISNTSYYMDNIEIQHAFSRFMLSLLKDYPKFLTKDYSVNKDISQSLKNMIDLKNYLNLYNNGDKCFYSKVFSTQMFMEFIFKRMMPKDCNEKVQILFIEEKIIEKSNEKKIFSKINKSKTQEQYILLNCKDYDFEDEIITIDLTEKSNDITSGLKNYLFNNKPLLHSFLKRGYNIIMDETNQKISFEYTIFPTLLSDKLFLLTCEQLQKAQSEFHNTIEIINTKIVNKSAVKFRQEKVGMNTPQDENENDLYLCYLIVWSLSFWYNEEKEKKYRFIEMLNILTNKIKEHDIKVFEILIRTLVEVGSDENAILLYKKYIDLRLNPSWEMFSLISKLIKKKQNIHRKSKLLHQETNLTLMGLIEKKDECKGNFSKRTFKIKNKDEYIFSSKLLFYSYFICKKCNGVLNLGKICSDLKNFKMEKDNYGIQRLKCSNKSKDGKICDYFCEQYLKLRLGEELFNQKLEYNKNLKYFTSIPSSIILLSPTEIKNSLIQIAMSKKKEEKFDVENFRYNYPDIFWSLIWFFDLNDINKNFMLPYENAFHDLEPNKNTNVNFIYKNFDEGNEDKKKDGIVRINAKIKNKMNINIIKRKKKEIKKYKIEDLRVQIVFEFGIIENIGLVTYKTIYSYQKNISFNEMPILPLDKDKDRLSKIFYYNYNESDLSTQSSYLRHSLMNNQVSKKGMFTPSSLKIAMLSKSGPGLSDFNLKITTRDSDLNKYIVFEENDDSLDENV